MQLVFIGAVLLPITPEKIEETKPGANETARLINDGEINILHSPGLKTYSFDVILPSQQSYPFQIYPLAGMEAIAFTTYFEELQKRKIPFPFIQVTWGANTLTNVLGLLNITYTDTLCTIEEQTVLKDAGNGQDVVISLSLKEYKDYGTKFVKQSGNNNGNITYKVTSQTSSYSYTAELRELAKEITSKIVTLGGVGAEVFEIASDTFTNPSKNWEKMTKFLGW